MRPCSTVITSQLPLEHWHAWLRDATLADTILDRLAHQARKLPVKGDSMRKKTQSDSAQA
jgi:DNA replication protein DnaC